MVTLEHNGKPTVDRELAQEAERRKLLVRFSPYGGVDGDTCPTCRGTGRIPRGQEEQLVAVIPCNDVRLKPRHTKLYVFLAMVLCLFVCCLILFFLFPRSVILTPVSVQSVMVYFTPDNISMDVTNLIKVSNENYVPVQVVQFNMQGLVSKTVMGKTTVTNMTSIQPRFQRTDVIKINLLITDKGLNNYCKSSSIKIHTLFVELQMTMNISYLSHMEQLSVDTFEYIDCGTNSTVPHPVR